ncbi:MAG TPA: hypothetical protein VLG08_09730 [Casimicrobiaceae bacterium]|jgi:hypothetical protein|nr:hypothetical protein [Casimicrobiaceae bacterium]
MRGARLRARTLFALATLLVPLLAHAAPISRADLMALCGDAEDPAQCGRLVEARQMRAVSRFVERDGGELRVQLVPYGLSVFRDTDSALGGGTSYAVWDYYADLDTVVLFTTRGERTGFLLLARRGGGEYRLPAEPVLSPDRRHFATADVCAQGCDNEVAVWRIDRDGAHKEASWKPPADWTDVTVAWRGTNAIALEYAVGNDAATRSAERRLDDPSWMRAR